MRYKSKMEAVNRAEDASYLHIDLLAFRLNAFLEMYAVVVVAAISAISFAILFEWLRTSHFIGGGFSCLVCRICSTFSPQISARNKNARNNHIKSIDKRFIFVNKSDLSLSLLFGWDVNERVRACARTFSRNHHFILIH